MINHERFNDNPKLPVESDDDAVLRMLSGANFGPNANITLPSGRALSGDEAQAFTSAFGARESDVDTTQEPRGRSIDLDEAHLSTRVAEDQKGDSPLSSRHDAWTGDPASDRARLVERAMAAAQSSSETSVENPEGNTESLPQESEKAHIKKWWKRNR